MKIAILFFHFRHPKGGLVGALRFLRRRASEENVMMSLATFSPASIATLELPVVATSWLGNPRLPSILVVDDDPLFCRAVVGFGKRAGIFVTAHDPSADIATLPRDGFADVAIVDYDLGAWTGAQLAVLFRKTAVLMVSASP